MFIAEAKKYQVFPMDASVAARIVAPRPNITAGRTEFVYTRPMIGLPQGDSPLLLNTSYTITADIEVPQGGAEGMILTSGGRFAGYGFYLLKGKPVFLWNMVDLERLKWEGPDALPPGRHTVEFDFKYEGIGAGTLAFNNFSGLGRPGTGTLKVDGKVVATKRMEKTLPMILQWDESFDIGSDTLTGVNDADYKPPFALTAKLNKLTIKVDRPQLSPEDIKKLAGGDEGEGEARLIKPPSHGVEATVFPPLSQPQRKTTMELLSRALAIVSIAIVTTLPVAAARAVEVPAAAPVMAQLLFVQNAARRRGRRRAQDAHAQGPQPDHAVLFRPAGAHRRPLPAPGSTCSSGRPVRTASSRTRRTPRCRCSRRTRTSSRTSSSRCAIRA